MKLFAFYSTVFFWKENCTETEGVVWQYSVLRGKTSPQRLPASSSGQRIRCCPCAFPLLFPSISKSSWGRQRSRLRHRGTKSQTQPHQVVTSDRQQKEEKTPGEALSSGSRAVGHAQALQALRDHGARSPGSRWSLSHPRSTRWLPGPESDSPAEERRGGTTWLPTGWDAVSSKLLTINSLFFCRMSEGGA